MVESCADRDRVDRILSTRVLAGRAARCVTCTGPTVVCRGCASACACVWAGCERAHAFESRDRLEVRLPVDPGPLSSRSVYPSKTQNCAEWVLNDATLCTSPPFGGWGFLRWTYTRWFGHLNNEHSGRFSVIRFKKNTPNVLVLNLVVKW